MITVNFEFKDSEKDELIQLNNILSTMKLDELRLENYSGCLVTTLDEDGDFIDCRYALCKGTLVCKLSEGEKGMKYRIDSDVICQSSDRDVYLQRWRDKHPDRIVRIFITSEFDGLMGCLIVHHQRDETEG